VFDRGMIMLQQGNHKLQCWNNEEWNSKLDRENEKHKGEINKYKKRLRVSQKMI
jgi:hypothetical protein